MRLAFVSGGSVLDRLAWSGTVYYAHRALAKRFDVVAIETPTITRAFRGVRKVLRPTGFDPMREPLFSRGIGMHLANKVASHKVHAVFSLAASPWAAGLVDRYPVFHCSDGTFAKMLGYHGEFSGLSRRTKRAGDAVERTAILRSAATILSSDWAAESIRTDYRRTKGIYVVPFGANLDEFPAEDTWRRTSKCSLLLIGVNWSTKGADLAVETVKRLNERGLASVLDVVGCTPPPGWVPVPFVRCHGFLRKHVPQECARLSDLLAHADFLILPTQFEAFGIVLCEAAAYGTPAIARCTGGIPTIIEDGVTGALMPASAASEAYANRIASLWSDETAYTRMRRDAFDRARNTLNWDTWSREVERIIRLTLSQEPPFARTGAGQSHLTCSFLASAR